MVRSSLKTIAIFALLGTVLSQASSFVGQDQNGVRTTCANGVCRNSHGHNCDVLSVSCWDWRCRNSPGRLLCMLSNTCVAAWCTDPNAAPAPPSATPSPKAPPKKFDINHCDGRRERKEFSCMSRTERNNFAKAFKALSEAGIIAELTKSYYNNVWEATGGSKWLPWGRTFLHRFENMAREVIPGFSVPYWDFVSHADDIAMAPIWDMKSGIGQSKRNKCIAKRPWRDYVAKYPEDHCIIRGFTSKRKGQALKIDGTSSMSRLIEASSYQEFVDAAEYSWHRIRMSVGGEMAKRVAPNDPLYYLLLASFDRYWMEWQDRNGYYSYEGEHRDGETTVDDNMVAFGERTIKDAMKIECVSYKDSCLNGEDPTEMPIMLWEPYLENNILPAKRMRRVESTMKKVLYGEENIEMDPSPEAE